MPSLKSTGELPGFNFSGALVSADEVDTYIQYEVVNPSIAGAYFNTGTFTSTTLTGVTPGTKNLDYPRNVAVTMTGGTVGGTATFSGQDQFGGTVTESIGAGTTAAGGTTNGTKVFARVGTITFTAANTNTGTMTFGVARGTSASGTPLWGLPTKIAGSADIKTFNWINNGTIQPFNTPSAQAGTQFHSFQGTTSIAITDQYIVQIRTTFNNSNGVAMTTGLGTT